LINDRTISRAKLRTVFALGLTLSIGGCGAAAETMSIECQAAGKGGLPAMSLVYEGGESGTLRIASTLGEMALDATRQEREGENEGVKYTVIGIRAFGPANVLMPERTAMETCIAGKATGDQANDADFVTMFSDACRREVPLGTAPVPITANVEIAVTEQFGAGAYVYLILTYGEKSKVPGEHIAINSLPPPNCTVTAPQ